MKPVCLWLPLLTFPLSILNQFNSRARFFIGDVLRTYISTAHAMRSRRSARILLYRRLLLLFAFANISFRSFWQCLHFFYLHVFSSNDCFLLFIEGNHYGRGAVRRNELIESCNVFGIPAKHIHILTSDSGYYHFYLCLWNRFYILTFLLEKYGICL